jgi:methionine-rich copper-binding protein CopC
MGRRPHNCCDQCYYHCWYSCKPFRFDNPASSTIFTAAPKKVNITAAKRLMEDSALVENAKKRKRSDDQAAKDAQKEHTEEAKKRTEQGQVRECRA